MNSSQIDAIVPVALAVSSTETELVVDLSDGRRLIVPLAWYPRLSHASARERSNWRLIGEGDGIHWPDLDEDISVEGLLRGKRSGEGSKSFERWLASRSGTG